MDPKTGLQDDSARWYDANLGQFVSPDPMGIAGSGTNLYAYCGNAPVQNVDPSGLCTTSFSPGTAFSAATPYSFFYDSRSSLDNALLGESVNSVGRDEIGQSLGYNAPTLGYPTGRTLSPAAPTPGRFMPIAVNQNSDWPGLGEINENRRYDEERDALGDYYAQQKTQLDQFNRDGSVTANGAIEAFGKAMYFGVANLSRAVDEPLFIAADTVNIAADVNDRQSGGQGSAVPLFSMSYPAVDRRFAAGESYASVAWSGAWRAPVNTFTLGAWGTAEGAAIYVQTGSPQAMQVAAANQLMLSLAAASVPQSGSPPAVLDPYAGSPMGTTPGGLYATPAEAVQSQLSGGYLADAWSVTTLRQGSKVFGGVPGQSAFYMDLATVRASGLNQQSLFQSLQVKPHPFFGYRAAVQAYQLTTEMNVPTGTTLNNNALGPGGGTQFFIPKFDRVLVPIGQPVQLSK